MNWPQINSGWKFRRHPPAFHPLQRGQSIKYFPEVNQYAYEKIYDDLSKYINSMNKVLLTFCPLISKMFKKVEKKLFATYEIISNIFLCIRQIKSPLHSS